MSTNLKIVTNNKRSTLINIKKMKKALSFSKKDVKLYFSILSTIIDKHSNQKIKSQAWKYLVKQDKLQSILDDLVMRLHSLKMQWNTQTSSSSTSCHDIIQQLNQLENEVRIFNEIHYTVKRTYFRFTNDFFQEEWKSPRKIA